MNAKYIERDKKIKDKKRRDFKLAEFKQNFKQRKAYKTYYGDLERAINGEEENGSSNKGNRLDEIEAF